MRRPGPPLGRRELHQGVVGRIVRTALATVVEAGCDGLTVCATSTCCPIPFTDLAQENHHACPCC
ncbi:hypothetical protein ACFWBH_20235 [Streptomyces sp. NPDC059999]|uniref:hypothetical protein n=1 Tax=unclassified Streptomyces TaxID=2593676 RepID=UPI0033330266